MENNNNKESFARLIERIKQASKEGAQAESKLDPEQVAKVREKIRAVLKEARAKQEEKELSK